jgi:DNA mismatch repair protein MutS
MQMFSPHHKGGLRGCSALASMLCSLREQRINPPSVMDPSFPLVENYYRLYDKYALLYPKVALLMQVGKFFEMYCPEDYSKGNVHELVKILNIELKLRAIGDPPSRMAGFPLNSVDKYVKILVDADYTVVKMEQSLDPQVALEQIAGSASGKIADRVPRIVTDVLSKGSSLETTRLRTNVLALHIVPHSKDQISVAIAVIDNSVSEKIIVHELHSLPNDHSVALDSAIRFLLQYDPVECIVVTKNGEYPENIVKHLQVKCPITRRDVQTLVHFPGEDGSFSDISLCAIDTVRTFLVEHHMRGENLVVVPYMCEDYLELCSTAVKQLDISMLHSRSDINLTVTPMGNRLFLNRLLNPIVDPILLNMRYNDIENMGESTARAWKEMLKDFPDIDRLHRRMSLGKLSFEQLGSLRSCYASLVEFSRKSIGKGGRSTASMGSSMGSMESMGSTASMESMGSTASTASTAKFLSHISTDCSTVLASLESTIDFNRKSEGSYFKKCSYEDLDLLWEKMERMRNVVATFINKVLACLKPRSKCEPRDTMGIEVTNLYADAIMKKHPEWKMTRLQKSSVIFTPELQEALTEKKILDEKIGQAEEKFLSIFLIQLSKDHCSLLKRISEKVAEMDLLQCAKNMAVKWKLVKPELTKEKKILNIAGLRHLLIESLNKDVRYIPNDLDLIDDIQGTVAPAGTEGTEGSKTSKGSKGIEGLRKIGMLLYGVNSCGKTSFLKSVGLAIIFAQAGLFVPAEKMVMKPLRKIMTRIAGGDNMERSQSSFIVELDELLSVLQRSNEDTLVLGDEMCRGTEMDSANAIVATILSRLVQRGSFFIAATHLHGIAGKISQDLPEIAVKHMEVLFTKDGEAIYERKLREGSGKDLYGLEIAKAMNFPADFIKDAFAFREMAVKEDPVLLITRKSRYNAKKILVHCELCFYKPGGGNSLPLDTHHIEFQCNADDDGYHGSQHKNALHNLVALCKQCHVDVHRNHVSLKVLQTLKGRKIIGERKSEDLSTSSYL